MWTRLRRVIAHDVRQRAQHVPGGARAARGRPRPAAVVVVMRVLLPVRTGRPRGALRDSVRRRPPGSPTSPPPPPSPASPSPSTSFASMCPPVREKKTSSSEGWRTSMVSTSTPASSSARTTEVANPGAASTPALRRRPSSLTPTTPVTRGAMAPTASGCGAASVTSRWALRLASFSSSGVPFAMTRPWSTTTMRCASASASSRYCVVNSTVTPSPSNSRMASHTRWRLVGSSPVVGSSRKSTGGRVMSDAARSRRRRMPPEYPLRTRSAASTSSNWARSSAALVREAARPMSESSPTRTRFCRPVRSGSSVASCAATPMWRRTSPGCCTTSIPATVAWPASGRARVVRMRTAVVFPAPLGPSRPRMEPAGTEKSTPASAWVSP